MGKLDVTNVRYLDREKLRVLTAIEMGMKNHELVPKRLVIAIAAIKGGGCTKILKELAKDRLIQYESSGLRYSGYRLTWKGYDFLGIKTLVTRGVIRSFGTQIGTGKESNIYSVMGSSDKDDNNDIQEIEDIEEEELCLKLHRLGRTCFRKIREKRDYHKGRKQMSWIYLSRISATKEFAYMKALYDRGFPVPKPIDFNRHIIVMELVPGLTLQQVSEVPDPAVLYDQLMKLLIKFADHGVIHGDFNEFNIMLNRETADPIIIDFPQMVSTCHQDAAEYFNRDVKCLQDFFRRRFGFESTEPPPMLFGPDGDVKRVDAIDAEIRASGITRNDEKELLSQLSKAVEESESTDDDCEESQEDSDSEDENCKADKDNVLEDIEISNEASVPEDLESLRKQVDLSTAVAMGEKNILVTEGDISHGIENAMQNVSSLTISDQKKEEVVDCNLIPQTRANRSTMQSESVDRPMSRYAPSSVASTIAPEVVKARVKASLEKQKRSHQTKRMRTKGDNSGVTRARNENQNEIKQSTDAFWDD